MLSNHYNNFKIDQSFSKFILLSTKKLYSLSYYLLMNSKVLVANIFRNNYIHKDKFLQKIFLSLERKKILRYKLYTVDLVSVV